MKVKCDEYLTRRIQQPILNLQILIFFSIFLVIPIMFDKENNNEYLSKPLWQLCHYYELS